MPESYCGSLRRVCKTLAAINQNGSTVYPVDNSIGLEYLARAVKKMDNVILVWCCLFVLTVAR